MSLILLNLKSKQQIELNTDSPFIIGRRNVFGCSDKRVSKNHGKITCTVDGEIRLAALHSNPCFFTRNGVPPIQQLNKNEEETLREGDHLGLLPDAFWFKITSRKEKEIKKEPNTCTTFNETNNISVSNSQAEERLNSGCESNVKLEKDNLISSPVLTSSAEPNLTGATSKLGTPEFEKTKRLPLWMYEIDEPKQSNKSPSKRPLPKDAASEGKKQKLSSEPEVKIETEVVNGVTNAKLPTTSKINTAVEDEPSNSTKESENTTPPQAEASKESTKEGYESNIDTEEHNAVNRPICQYEGNCYRKNPQHKLEFCHPGDTDYIPYEERPLCQFGSACYRRNEQHKVEYRHPPRGSNPSDFPSPSCSRASLGEERPPCLRGSSCCNQNSQHPSSPLPDKRRRKTVKKQNSDYENDDEYDLEDPFINDASSDEYVPSELDSEEEEEEEEEEETLDSSREDH